MRLNEGLRSGRWSTGMGRPLIQTCFSSSTPPAFHVSLSANGTFNQPRDQGAWAFSYASSVLYVTVAYSSGLLLLFTSSPCWTTATHLQVP